MQTVVLSGVLTNQGATLQAEPVAMVHDFGRPVSIASVRLVSFSYPFTAYSVFLRGQFEFTLRNLDAVSRSQNKLTLKHGQAPQGTADANLPNYGDVTKSYTWSCPYNSTVNTDGVYDFDFPTTEAKTRVTPAAPFFADRLELEFRFQQLAVPVTFVHFPPSNPGCAFSVTLEITEA